jgi:two-component system NarL family response regulator
MNIFNHTSSCIRVLIADPHVIIREGIAAVLSRQSDMLCVGQAQNGQETLSLIAELKPDVVMMEIDFPDTDGKSLIADIHTRLPSISILVLTSHAGDKAIYQALRMGAKGYVCKDASAEAVTEAIRTIHSGQNALAQHIPTMLALRFHALDLTPREQEVLLHIAQGQSNKEIASTLFIGEGTVKSHVNHLMGKMQVRDRTQAAIMGIKRGLVPAP